MADRLIGQMDLDNGLVLVMYDRSRPVAGDRGRVEFSARIEAAVTPDLFAGPDGGGVDFPDLVGKVGETAVYRYDKTRNFIREKDKESVLAQLKQDFLDNNLAYLSHPDFPRRLVLRRYREAQSTGPVWRPW